MVSSVLVSGLKSHTLNCSFSLCRMLQYMAIGNTKSDCKHISKILLYDTGMGWWRHSKKQAARVSNGVIVRAFQFLGLNPCVSTIVRYVNIRRVVVKGIPYEWMQITAAGSIVNGTSKSIPMLACAKIIPVALSVDFMNSGTSTLFDLLNRPCIWSWHWKTLWSQEVVDKKFTI